MNQETEFNWSEIAAQLNKAGVSHINGLTLDSRSVQPGDVFLAVPGSNGHGLQHAEQAILNGAVAILLDPDASSAHLAQELASRDTICMMTQPSLAHRIGLLASSFYQHPSRDLSVIGITGTNGKTSCSQYIAQALSALGKTCGYSGTLGWGINDVVRPTSNTTVDAVTQQRILAEMRENNASAVALEVSSHGLAQNRLQGIDINGAVFTHFGRDHLDYHSTVEQYLASKLKLFSRPELNYAVINMDDAQAPQILASIVQQVQVIGYTLEGAGLNNADDLRASDIEFSAQGCEFDVLYRGQCEHANLPLIGRFNIANALAVLGVLIAEGIEFSTAVHALSALHAVAGRMELIDAGAGNSHQQAVVYVDYAHTPDALLLALQSVRASCQGAVHLVFGCGGNRDQGKRKLMGEAAAKLADQIILTDDNPRNEDGDLIINQILKGCRHSKPQIIRNRTLAIQHAIANAAVGDVVLIAGKGHETSQEINGRLIECDDRVIAKNCLQRRVNSSLAESRR